MQNRSNGWMWLPNWSREEEREPVLAYFRGILPLDSMPERLPVKVTADSKYKLYVNGVFAEMGPSRGNDKVWYVDTVDVAPFLRTGENVLAVEVLRYPCEHWKGNHGIFRTETPGLYVEMDCTICWKCQAAEGFQIVAENPYFAPMMIYEQVSGDQRLSGWMLSDFNDDAWETPVFYKPDVLPAVLRPEQLVPRTIPFLYHKEHRFAGVSKGQAAREWTAMLTENQRLKIPAYTTVSVDIDAGELTTGYLRLRMARGAQTVITLLQAECYAGEIVPHADPYKSLPQKGDRTDASLSLYGHTDTYCAAGLGTEDRPEVYEPFWFRTFRFVRLTVATAGEPLTLLGFDYAETGYPLKIRAKVAASDPTLGQVWDICERSLRRCMHETYEDCPFYEQLQYAMDARSEMLYTYAAACDDRLAVKCMEDFTQSRHPDGMINCSYPNFETNVIPGFSIYFIGMVYDHMWYFGDKEQIQKCWGTVESILAFFQNHLDSRGIVGKIGGINRGGQYWSFIDWTTGWDETDGVPPATRLGPITMESLLYLLGLQYAAEIADYMGMTEQAQIYRSQADRVREAVNCHCVGIDGLYQDGPGVEQYSQHCQVFAVLTDTAAPETGRRILKRTLENPEKFERCSVAMCWYLFRALEKIGLYQYTDRLWDIWRQMLADNLTTCPEDPLLSRSDCHAWGALALYELPAVVLGVRPGKPGFEEILIIPRTENLDWAEGTVPTPKGNVHVSWRKGADGKVQVTANGPKGVPITVIESK